jgi:hypothetical protein
MDEIRGDVSVAELRGAGWRKSRASNASGNCVEVAALRPGVAAVRDSRRPDGPALVCTPARLAVFVRRVKNGEFDRPPG